MELDTLQRVAGSSTRRQTYAIFSFLYYPSDVGTPWRVEPVNVLMDGDPCRKFLTR